MKMAVNVTIWLLSITGHMREAPPRSDVTLLHTQLSHRSA